MFLGSQSLILPNSLAAACQGQNNFDLKNAEFSGMAWAGDYLILLPQYPGEFSLPVRPRHGPRSGCIFYVKKDDIKINGSSSLTLQTIRFEVKNVPGNWDRNYQGYEAIAFNDEDVFLTIEMKKNRSYLVKGRLERDNNGIPTRIYDVDFEKRKKILKISRKSNSGEEALIFIDGKAIVIHEYSGKGESGNSPFIVRSIDDGRVGKNFSVLILSDRDRITDATANDSTFSKFWVISRKDRKNFFINKLRFEIQNDVFVLSTEEEIRILSDGKAHNWEGIVRFSDSINDGFLVVEDTNRNDNGLLWFIDLQGNHFQIKIQ